MYSPTGPPRASEYQQVMGRLIPKKPKNPILSDDPLTEHKCDLYDLRRSGLGLEPRRSFLGLKYDMLTSKINHHDLHISSNGDFEAGFDRFLKFGGLSDKGLEVTNSRDGAALLLVFASQADLTDKFVVGKDHIDLIRQVVVDHPRYKKAGERLIERSLAAMQQKKPKRLPSFGALLKACAAVVSTNTVKRLVLSGIAVATLDVISEIDAELTGRLNLGKASWTEMSQALTAIEIKSRKNKDSIVKDLLDDFRKKVMAELPSEYVPQPEDGEVFDEDDNESDQSELTSISIAQFCSLSDQKMERVHELDPSVLKIGRQFGEHLRLVFDLLVMYIKSLKKVGLTAPFSALTAFENMTTEEKTKDQSPVDADMLLPMDYWALRALIPKYILGTTPQSTLNYKCLTDFTDLRACRSKSEVQHAIMFQHKFRKANSENIKLDEEASIEAFIASYAIANPKRENLSRREFVVHEIWKRLVALREDQTRRGETTTLQYMINFAEAHSAKLSLENGWKTEVSAESSGLEAPFHNPVNETACVVFSNQHPSNLKKSKKFKKPNDKFRKGKPFNAGVGQSKQSQRNDRQFPVQASPKRLKPNGDRSEKAFTKQEHETGSSHPLSNAITSPEQGAMRQLGNFDGGEPVWPEAETAFAITSLDPPVSTVDEGEFFSFDNAKPTLSEDDYVDPYAYLEIDLYSQSVLDSIEELNPVHAELDAAVHCCHVRVLAHVTKEVQNKKFWEDLKKSTDTIELSSTLLAMGDTCTGRSMAMEARFILKLNKRMNEHERRMKRVGRKNLHTGNAGAPVPRATETLVSDVTVNTHVDESGLASRRDTATVVMKKRPDKLISSNDRDCVAIRTGESCRKTLTHWAAPTNQRSCSDRESLHLGTQASSSSISSIRRFDHDGRAHKSPIVSCRNSAIVDSGTTISIAMTGEGLMDFDSNASTKIMGFNGSISRSTGIGTISGVVTSDGGRDIQIEIPGANVLPGAPNNLVSVRALSAQGNTVVFAPTRAFIQTPEKVRIDLVDRSGLYWLHWDQSDSTKGRPRQTTDVRTQLSALPRARTITNREFAEDVKSRPKRSQCCNLAHGSGKRISVDLAHRRFGHFAKDKIVKMLETDNVGLTLTNRRSTVCDICLANKLTRNTVPKSRENPPVARAPLERVWTDVKGKLEPDFWGNQYFVSFTCEVTRFTVVYVCRLKSDVKTQFESYLEWVKLQGRQVRILNSDGGGEYTANEFATVMSDFQQVCKKHSIQQQFTGPNTSAQNGISERLNRTLMEAVRCVLHEAGLTHSFWSLALRYVCLVRNRIWHDSLMINGRYVSPFEALFGRLPCLLMFRVFGCDVWVLDANFKKSVVAPKGIKCIFVGISDSRKGWVVMDLQSRKLRTSYHVIFDESLQGRRCALMDRKLPWVQSSIPNSKTAVEEFFHDYSSGDEARIQEQPDAEIELDNSDLHNCSPDSEHPAKRRRVTRTVTDPQNGGSDESSDQRYSQPKPGGIELTAEGDHVRELLKKAFNGDWPIEYTQKNPKAMGSKSRERFERYKGARTLRQAYVLGASAADVLWDYSRGFLTVLQNTEESFEPKNTSVTATAIVDESLHFTSASLFGNRMITQDIQQCAHLIDDVWDMSEGARDVVERLLQTKPLSSTVRSCAVTAATPIPIPKTRKEALASPYAAEFRKAEIEELTSMKMLNAFELVSETTARIHGKLVGCKWVYSVKYNPDGTVQRFKARLVAQGFTQRPGIDFNETFSPVCSYNSLRVLFALSAALDLRLDVWDLKNGFLQQEIDVPHLYMRCPEGYPQTMSDGTPAVFRCLMSIYGLKQSSRLLSIRMSAYLAKLGYEKLRSEECIFTKGSGNDRVIIGIWVDDIILASARDNEQIRIQFDADLRKEFKVSPWTSGEAQVYLGISITRDWERGTLRISSPRSIEGLATKFNLNGLEGRNPHVPMEKDLRLTKATGDKIVPTKVFDYPAAVGGLLYLTVTTRPDVAYAVGVLCRFTSCPGIEHVEAVKQVIRYLLATKDDGITYSKFLGSSPHLPVATEGSLTLTPRLERPNPPQTLLSAYADADLAGDFDTSKSTTGYALILHGGVVSWMSKLQTTVALSTAQAETNAAVEAVKQIMHTRLLLGELGFPQVDPTPVYEDNNAAISIAHNKENAKHAKHFKLKVHFLREQVERGTFEYRKVTTREQLADAFTKALPRIDLDRCREWMGMKPKV